MTYFYQSSITGLFVTKAYALRNPDTTEKKPFRYDRDDRRKEYIDYLTEEFENAPGEDKAEWQIEIMDALTDWRKAMIGDELVP